jgi:hypothetical protein
MTGREKIELQGKARNSSRAIGGVLRAIFNTTPPTHVIQGGDWMTADEYKKYQESGQTGCPKKGSGSVSEQTRSTTCGN